MAEVKTQLAGEHMSAGQDCILAGPLEKLPGRSEIMNRTISNVCARRQGT